MARLRLCQRAPWSGDIQGDAGLVVRLRAQETRFAPCCEHGRKVCPKRVQSRYAIQIEYGRSFKISDLEDRGKFAQRLPRKYAQADFLQGGLPSTESHAGRVSYGVHRVRSQRRACGYGNEVHRIPLLGEPSGYAPRPHAPPSGSDVCAKVYPTFA